MRIHGIRTAVLLLAALVTGGSASADLMIANTGSFGMWGSPQSGPITSVGLSIGRLTYGLEPYTICSPFSGCHTFDYPFAMYGGAQVYPATGSVRLLEQGFRTWAPGQEMAFGSFEDTFTFVNPNPIVTPIGIVVNLGGNVQNAEIWYGWGNIGVPQDYLQGMMAFDFSVSGLPYCVDPDFFNCTWTGPFSGQISGMLELPPGITTFTLSSDLTTICLLYDERGVCDYRSTLLFDTGSTGVTFSTGSGVTLTSIPEPACFTMTGGGLAALISFIRTAKRKT